MSQYVEDEKIMVKKNNNYHVAKVISMNNKSVNVMFINKNDIEKYGTKPEKINIKDTKKYITKKIIKKKNSSSNSSVSPLFWVLANKKQFPDWINKTFIKYKSTGKENKNPSGFKPFKYQLFLRDYMQFESPYRGILLYHGLGSGKSCTSIQIAENLKNLKNIVVILPASLKDNYITDGLKFCGDPIYKTNPNEIFKKYTFISSNASNTVQQMKQIGGLDNKVIIVDEAHNLISRMVGGITGDNSQGRAIYDMLMDAKDSKIVFLTGTPVVNNIFEAAIMYNVLRGYIYVTVFKIVYVDDEYGKQWNLRRVEEEIEKLQGVDYVETIKQSKTMEISILSKPWHEDFEEIIRDIENKGKEMNVGIEYLDYKKFTLFPDSGGEGGDEDFKKVFISESSIGYDKMKNKNIFAKRILGLTSYYKSSNQNLPSVKYHDTEKIAMDSYQFNEYYLVRSEEKKSRQLNDIRVFSRQYSNFAFPPEIIRPGIGEKLQKKNNEQNEKIFKVSSALEKEENKELAKEEDIKKLEKSVKNALSKLEKGDYLKINNLGKYSNKMKRIFENIKKTNGLVFIYSDFRTLEGVEVFAKVLEANGYSKFSGSGTDSKSNSKSNNKSNNKSDNKLNKKQNKTLKYAIYSGLEDFNERNKILKTFTASNNKYGEHIKCILATSAGAEGLDLKNIRQVHIMEPYWNEVRIKQVIGRAVRRNSHIDLPKNEQNVEVFRYLSVISEEDKKFLKPKEQISTDEIITEIARKKEYITEEMLTLMKEASVDCVLNAFDNGGNINCFTFGKNNIGLSYLPNLERDIGSGSEYQMRDVKESLRLGGISDDGKVYFVENKKIYLVTDILKKNPLKTQPKIKKKIAINLSDDSVYDYNAAVSAKRKVEIGKYNNKGEFYKA